MTLTVTLIRSEVQEADSPPVLSQKHTERGRERKDRDKEDERKTKTLNEGRNTMQYSITKKNGGQKEVDLKRLK